MTVAVKDTNVDDVLDVFSVFLRSQRHLRKHPLLVVGAGVSKGEIPLLADIGSWLARRLRTDDLSPKLGWLVEHSEDLARGRASRRQVAELFTCLQSAEPISSGLSAVWNEFSRALLIDGFEIDGQSFSGISSARARETHRRIASEIRDMRCWTVSLNFDGLIYQALRWPEVSSNFPGLSLHSEVEFEHYFCSRAEQSIPAVFNIRGDVFYATCTQPLCPRAVQPYPIADDSPTRGLDPGTEPELPDSDRLALTFEEKSQDGSNALSCNLCGGGTLSLQFSFPGLRAKEELAFPLLWKLRRFLGPSISAIVVIGLSGMWDRYLLQFLFDLSSERRIPVLDIKPEYPSQNPIETFRAAHFPSIYSRGLGSVQPESTFTFVSTTAEHALPILFSK